MKISRLYQIFSEDDSEVEAVERLDQLMEDDVIRLQSAAIGMQHFLMQAPVFKNYYPDNFDEVFPIIKSKAYRRIYSFIENVNIESLRKRDVSFYPDEIKLMGKTLEILLEFFEEIEEYIICAELKRILDYLYIEVRVVKD